MNPKDKATDEGEESGEGGGGEGFGSPRLKPNVEALFDPHAALAEGVPSDETGDGRSGKGSGEAGAPLSVGEWEYHADAIMLYHRRLKKRLMLEQLNSPTKMMKVIVALATQKGWETENLIRAMDLAAQTRFGKPLYQLVSLSQDSATFDWKSGQVRPETGRSPQSGSHF